MQENKAYWHIRLALILRGDDIHHVNIINRSFERSIKLMKAFQMTQDGRVHWRKDIKFSAMSPDFGDYGRLLKEEVRKADVIFLLHAFSRPAIPSRILDIERRQEEREIYCCYRLVRSPHGARFTPTSSKRPSSPTVATTTIIDMQIRAVSSL